VKTIPQSQLLEALEEKVERHLQEAVSTFQNLSGEVLLRAAENGGWSIAQCLEHLNTYGQYYHPHLQKALAASGQKQPDEPFESSWLGAYFIRTMDPVTGTAKFKAVKQHTPATDLDAPAVVGEFIRQQEELLQYLRQARTADLNHIRIPISLTKWIKLKLGDIFQVLVAHNERHIRQARRNLKAGT
jgi:hypothetical protein